MRATNAEVLAREKPTAQDKKISLRFTFKFLNQTATYVSDFSEIWDHGAREYLSVRLLGTALQHAASLAGPGVGAIVEVFARTAQVAVCWKRLLEASVSNIQQFLPHIGALLKTPRFLAAPEVAVATGNVLKAAYADALFSESDKFQVENAIQRIPQSRFIKRYEKAESIQNRLILCIGADRLLSPELRARAEQLARKQPEFVNEPYVRIRGGAIPYSTEQWLQDQGADTNKKENADILEAIKPVTEFEHRFLNSTPSKEECLAVEPHLRRLHELLQQQTETHGSVSEHSKGVLYAAAESVVKNQELGQQVAVIQFCRTILLQGAVDPSPVFEAKYHLPFDMPAWGSPLPRIEAAQGISHLLWNYGPDEELVQTFLRLTDDAVPAVRYQVAVGVIGFYKHHNQQRFWDIVTKMMSFEETPGVMLGLLETLGRVAGNEPERVVDQLTRAIDRGLPATDRAEVTRTLVQILTGLYIVRADEKASNQLARFEAEPIRYASAVGDEVFTASHYLIPNSTGIEGRSRARELFQRVLASCYKQLSQVQQITDQNERRDALKALMRHIDEVASRIYFALDIHPDLQTPERTLTEDQRRNLYFEIKPLIASLAHGAEMTSDHHLLPGAAHYLLQTLNGVLRYDPANIIKLASQVCKAASALSYQFDSMAISEVVKLTEQSLADHKDTLKDPSVATALGEILDIFVRAGWPAALQLTFKLDQAVR